MRLAILASHPIQYQAPLFRELGRRVDLTVFFAHNANAIDQSNAGFGVHFIWDVDLLSGYSNKFLQNVSRRPGLDHFGGCDTPSITSELRGAKFDALLVMGWHLKCFWQAIWAAKRLGIPVAVRGDSHLETPRSTFRKVAKEFSYPAALRVFDAGLYVGERSRKYWLHYGYPSARLFFSPHCIDNEWFSARAGGEARSKLRTKLGVGAGTEVAMFAGKLLDFKRPLDVVAAVEIVRAQGRDLKILVAGSGPLEDAMTAAAAASNVPLLKLGFCNQSEMPAAYAAADVLVLPSDGNETWGLVANEALACGRPIVVSDACGCALDLAADGLVGRTFPTGDVASMARALTQVLDHRPLEHVIAERAATYSLAAAADGICAALEAVQKVGNA